MAITINVSLLSIGQGQAGLALTKGEDTLAFVDGCAEDALLKLRASSAYIGGPISRPEGTCVVSNPQPPSGNIYSFTVSTTNTVYKRTVSIVANRGSTITLTSWKEI